MHAMTTDSRLLYSQLPATDRLLRDSAFQPLLDTYGHTRVVNTLRAMQEAARLARRCPHGAMTGPRRRPGGWRAVRKARCARSLTLPARCCTPILAARCRRKKRLRR